MSFTFDWLSLEHRLFEQSRLLIRQFATEHPDLLCSFFAYAANPAYGTFLLNFESEANMLFQAQQEEQREIERRARTLHQEWSWRTAKSHLRSLRESGPSGDEFAYSSYATIHFEELDALGASGESPQNPYEWGDSYLTGNVQILLWKVIERLIAHEAFASLRLASPFRIGYQVNDEDLVTLRFLNWPQR